jgi:hypothetical protein
MASMGGGPLEPEPLLRLVKSGPMLLKVLTAICKAEGLQSTGIKATLQGRISDSKIFLFYVAPLATLAAN